MCTCICGVEGKDINFFGKGVYIQLQCMPQLNLYTSCTCVSVLSGTSGAQ